MVRWLGVEVRSATEEVAKKIRKRADNKRSPLSYPKFREMLAKEGGLSPAQTLEAIKIFKPEEGLPDRSKYHLFRKYETSGSERCCMVRNPRPEELLAFESNEEELRSPATA